MRVCVCVCVSVSSSLCCLFCWPMRKKPKPENVSCAMRTPPASSEVPSRPPAGPRVGGNPPGLSLSGALCWPHVEITVVHSVRCKLLPSWRNLLVFMCTNATLILGTLVNLCLRVIRVVIVRSLLSLPRGEEIEFPNQWMRIRAAMRVVLPCHTDVDRA